MITVTRYSGGITIEGHAGYAPRGQDIVCAGISTLVQTLIQSFEDLCADEITYHLKPGWVEIKHGDLSAKGLVLVNSFFIGVYMIADRYQDHVKVIHNTGASIEPPTKKAMENTEKQNS
jgi:uncharacterized protein YsxB (DUF464 family)